MKNIYDRTREIAFRNKVYYGEFVTSFDECKKSALEGATEQKSIDDKRIKELEDKEKAFLNWIAQKKYWCEFGEEERWEITYTIQKWFENYKAMEE